MFTVKEIADSIEKSIVYDHTHENNKKFALSKISDGLEALGLTCVMQGTAINLSEVLGPKTKEILELNKIKINSKALIRSVITDTSSGKGRHEIRQQKGTKVLDPSVFSSWKRTYSSLKKSRQGVISEMEDSIYDYSSKKRVSFKVLSIDSTWTSNIAQARLSVVMCNNPTLYSYRDESDVDYHRVSIWFRDNNEAMKACPEYGKNASMSVAVKKAIQARLKSMVETGVQHLYSTSPYYMEALSEMVALIPEPFKSYMSQYIADKKTSSIQFPGLPSLQSGKLLNPDFEAVLKELEEAREHVLRCMQGYAKVEGHLPARGELEGDWLGLVPLIMEATKDVDLMILWSLSPNKHIKAIADLALELQE